MFRSICRQCARVVRVEMSSLHQNKRYSSESGRNKPPPFKIYTKTGDKGTSGTIAGDRRPKDDVIFEALGTTDELTSSIGLAREYCAEANLDLEDQLVQIQCVIQDAGSNIATPKSDASPNQIRATEFDTAIVEDLESWIDTYTAELPPLKNFILPGGGKSSSSLHLARAICRRAERRVSPLLRDDEINPEVGRFLNRLSDYLFTVARYAAFKEGREETVYRKMRRRETEH